MQTFRLRRTGVSILAVVLLWLVVTPAHAQTFTQADVAEQKRAVMMELVETLEQHFKLLQMLLITQLENRVDELQAQLAAE